MRRVARPLMYIGTFVIVLLVGRIHAQFIGHYYFHSSARLPWTVAYAVLLSVAAYGVGLPDVSRGIRSTLSSAFGAVLVGAGAISAVQLLLGSLLLPRFVVAVAAGLVLPWLGTCAWLANAGRGRQELRDRVVAVVGDEEGALLQRDIGLNPERPATLVGLSTVEDLRSPRARTSPLVDAAVTARATVVVLDRDAQNDESVVAQAAFLHETGVRVRTLSLFYDEWLGKLPINELERISLMFDIGEIHRVRYGRVKRVVDVVLGVVGLAAFLVAVPIVLVGNLIANRGPLFYRQQRVGKNGSRFEILKFRTMKPEGSALANEWTSEDDPRITPFGRLLRVAHVDELPQMLNILNGDLSVVGPRPEQPRYVDDLTVKLPFYALRHLVRPGLTGWAQVKYGYAGSESDALEKLQYEFYYLRHQGLLLDLRIIGRTLRSVVGRAGR